MAEDAVKLDWGGGAGRGGVAGRGGGCLEGRVLCGAIALEFGRHAHDAHLRRRRRREGLSWSAGNGRWKTRGARGSGDFRSSEVPVAR